MKNLLFVFILLMLITAISCSSCKKSTPDPVSQLPPETQTGANTFGCLINGVAFKPKGSLFGPPSLQCAYQYLNGGYYFQLSASNNSNDNSVGIFTYSLRIRENSSYALTDAYIINTAFGQYSHITQQNYQYARPAYSNKLYPGNLTITKYDSINQIVSGSFWFNVIDSISRDTIKITNGRFDMHYTL